MKKIICFMTLIFLSAGITLASAEESYLTKINGHRWQESSDQEKIAFIAGMEAAFAIEYAIQQKDLEKPSAQQKKYILTPYAQGWLTAFKDKKPTNIVKAINDFYSQHKDKLDRNVLETIYYEFLKSSVK